MEKGNARTPPRGGEPRMTRAHPARRHVRAYPILKMPPRYRMKSGTVYPHMRGGMMDALPDSRRAEDRIAPHKLAKTIQSRQCLRSPP